MCYTSNLESFRILLPERGGGTCLCPCGGTFTDSNQPHFSESSRMNSFPEVLRADPLSGSYWNELPFQTWQCCGCLFGRDQSRYSFPGAEACCSVKASKTVSDSFFRGLVEKGSDKCLISLNAKHASISLPSNESWMVFLTEQFELWYKWCENGATGPCTTVVSHWSNISDLLFCRERSWMISVFLSRIVVLTAGTLYPAYRSYKAVRTKVFAFCFEFAQQLYTCA